MFAQPAALLFFVTIKLADRKPFEWFFKRALVGCDHPRQGRSQFRPHRNFALAFVGEIEKLIDNFSAAFFSVELSRLQDRAVPFHETVLASDLPPSRENEISG